MFGNGFLPTMLLNEICAMCVVEICSKHIDMYGAVLSGAALYGCIEESATCNMSM